MTASQVGRANGSHVKHNGIRESLRRTARSTSVLFALVASRNATGASFVPLGDLPGGIFQSTPSDVSADGSVVVGASVVRPYQTTWGFEALGAFRWTRDRGMAGLRSRDVIGWATGVSADGAVVVGCCGEIARWTPHGVLVEPIGIAWAYGVSADGAVVVGSQDARASRWTADGGVVDLGDLPGGSNSSRANAVSADGAVVVGEAQSTAGTEAFRWTKESGMIGLGALPDGSRFYSTASGVSADGSVVVGASGGQGGEDARAFRWTRDAGMVELGQLAGGVGSGAIDVSDDGNVIVGWANSERGPEAFLWDATDGMRTVSSVLADLGVSTAGWQLSGATAISADRTTIVGFGINPSGATEAWLANLTPVPEPASFAIAAPTLLVLSARRRPRSVVRRLTCG